MKRFKNILVAVDTRFEDQPVAEEAAAIARHNGGRLKIVDVVPDFPWTVRLTMSDHEHVRELLKEEKKEKLRALAETLQGDGLEITTKVLEGRTSVGIVREVLRDEHDLVMRVTKGPESRHTGFFGGTGLQLLRKCPCSVWLMMPSSRPKFQRVVGCVDTSSGDSVDDELNNKVYELASSIAAYHGGEHMVVQAWSIWNEQMLRSRMSPEELDALIRRSEVQVSSLLDKFLEAHGEGIRDKHAQLINGEPSDAIPEFLEKYEADLVVMGTVGRSGLSGVLMGNTAERILGRVNCALLALKPDDFKCPIHLDD